MLCCAVSLPWCAAALSVTTTELHSLQSYEEYWVSKEVMRAHMKALDAYSCVSWEEAVRMAQQVRKVC